MSGMSRRTERRLDRVAELRSVGKTWALIAAETGSTPEACEALAARHPREWGRLLRKWLRVRALEGAIEGLTILRAALREKEAATRRAAAVGLTHYLRLLKTATTRGQKAEEGVAPAGLPLKDMSDEELDEFLARSAARRRVAPAFSIDPPESVPLE